MTTFPNWSANDEARAAPYIDYWAAYFRIDPAVAYAVAALESAFKPNAYRAEPQINDASYGLFQVLLGTARGMGFTGTTADLMDPDLNTMLGLQYLRQMLDRFGSLARALSAYNGGLRNGVITNQSYVDGVMARANYFRETWGGDAPVSDDGTMTQDRGPEMVIVTNIAIILALAWAARRYL